MRTAGEAGEGGKGGEGRLFGVLVTREERIEVLGTEVGGVTGTGAGLDDAKENLLISGDDTLLAGVELLAMVFLFDSKSATSSGAAVMLFISASYTI